MKDLVTPVTLINVLGGKKKKLVDFSNKKVLLDSGVSHSLCSFDVSIRSKNFKTDKQSFTTGGGLLKTKNEAIVIFNLAELSESKQIKWRFHVCKESSLGYDMITGRDLMKELGIILDFLNNLIT